MQKLILLRGLGHSGSTILDFTLSSHPDIVGLGEAFRLLDGKNASLNPTKGPYRIRHDERYTRLCSCGRHSGSCIFWDPVLEWTIQNDEAPFIDKARCLFQQFDKLYGNEKILLDSSQSHIESVDQLQDLFDVRVVHLVRDYRSWVYSRAQNARTSTLRLAFEWYRANKRREWFLEERSIKYFLLGYEEFALRPAFTLDRLCKFLGIEFTDQMLSPGKHNTTHILSGNRMRKHPDAMRDIRYDGKWLAQSGISWPWLLWPFLSKANIRWVYSNFEGAPIST